MLDPDLWTLSEGCISYMPTPNHVMLLHRGMAVCPANVFGKSQQNKLASTLKLASGGKPLLEMKK